MKEDGELMRRFNALNGPRGVYFEFASRAKETVVATECGDFAVDRDRGDARGKEVNHPTTDVALRGILDRTKRMREEEVGEYGDVGSIRLDRERGATTNIEEVGEKR